MLFALKLLLFSVNISCRTYIGHLMVQLFHRPLPDAFIRPLLCV